MSAGVLDVAEQVQGSGAASRVPLARRVVATLEASRALLGIDLADDDQLRRVADGDRLVALELVEHTSAAVIDRLSTGPGRTVRILEVQALLAELQSDWYELQQELLARQVTMLDGIRLALHRLRGVETMSQMIERVTVEVCRSCGLDRCVLLRVDEGRLVAESIHFDDAELQEEWTHFARANPPVVDPRDPEIQLLRRNRPILVSDPETSRGIRGVAEAADSRGYVAAPVIVRGNVVGTLHADRTTSGEVDVVARDVLGLFAEGFGFALERTALLGRVHQQFSKIREMMAAANTTLEDVFDAGVSLRRDQENGELDIVPRGPSMALGFASESRLMGLLTRRELEVVQLMARGASNADIANELVISEGTVKSHVKHILRKMRAANRAQAVSCYMRLQSMSAN
jgi:DNA-binding CsgD family transcriptional regulator